MHLSIKTSLSFLVIVVQSLSGYTLPAQTENLAAKKQKIYLYYATCTEPVGCPPFIWIAPIHVYEGPDAEKDHTADIRKSAPEDIEKETGCRCNSDLGIVIKEYKAEEDANADKDKLINRSIAANNYKVYYSNTITTSFSVDMPPMAISLENAPPEIQASLLPYKLKAAIQLYDGGDYENAFKYFNRIASKGFTPAYYWLGKVYYEGKGVPQNYLKANEWLLKGEKAKDPNAIYMSGLLLYEGKAVKSDKLKGLQKIKEAVKYNQTEASIFLMENTEDGLLLKKALDHQKVSEHDLAFPLVYKAAMNKFEMAYLYLGMMHVLGEGTEPDETKAFQWFSESAKWGHAVGKYFLGVSYLEGIGVPINEALGIQWLKQSHDMGLEGATTKLEELGVLEKK